MILQKKCGWWKFLRKIDGRRFFETLLLLCFYCCYSFQTLPFFHRSSHSSLSLFLLQPCVTVVQHLPPSLVYAPPPWLCVGRSNSQWLASCPIKVLVNFTLEVFLSSRLWNPAWRWNFTQFWRIKPQHPLWAIHNLWSHAKYMRATTQENHDSTATAHTIHKMWRKKLKWVHFDMCELLCSVVALENYSLFALSCIELYV